MTDHTQNEDLTNSSIILSSYQSFSRRLSGNRRVGNLSSRNRLHSLHAFNSQPQMLTADMNVFGGHSNVGMPEQVLNRMDIGAGFRQSGGVGMPAGMQVELFRQAMLPAKSTVSVIEGLATVVSTFESRKQKRRGGKQCKQKLKFRGGSLSRWKYTTSILCLSDTYANCVSIISNVSFVEPYRFFWTQADIEHQNRSLPQRIWCNPEILSLKFRRNNKVAALRTRQQSHLRSLSDVSPLFSKSQCLAQRSKVVIYGIDAACATCGHPIDVHGPYGCRVRPSYTTIRCHCLGFVESPSHVSIDLGAVDLIQPEEFPCLKSQDSLCSVSVEIAGTPAFGVHSYMFKEDVSHVGGKEWCLLIGRKSELSKRYIRFQLGFDISSLIDIGLTGRPLKAPTTPSEIVPPILSDLKDSHMEVKF